MTGISAILLALVVIGLPTLVVGSVINRYFKLREKKLEVDATFAVEKAAQYAARTSELEQRIRVLEQIVTDAGAQTAAQIEALRPAKPLKAIERKRTSGKAEEKSQ